MWRTERPLQVTLASDGFYPRSFRWQGGLRRVLSVEGVGTFGAERRYWVRTAEGLFELGLIPETGLWRLRRAPGWFSRVWARWRRSPRYPLPVWRRRVDRPVLCVRPAPRDLGEEGCYAGGLALVRQRS